MGRLITRTCITTIASDGDEDDMFWLGVSYRGDIYRKANRNIVDRFNWITLES